MSVRSHAPGGNRSARRAVGQIVRIDIWSDVVCPWCYIGKRRLETALSQFDHRDDVELYWHAFELDPQAQAAAPGQQVAKLVAKYGLTEDQARESLSSLRATGAQEGLELRLDLSRSSNTFDAHRLLAFAADAGRQAELKERLMRAYFSEGSDVGDHDTLRLLAIEVGLSDSDVSELLAGDRYADQVRNDEAQARQLGISGVPFFVLDAKFGVSGAQPAAVFSQALQRAWDERDAG
jgi:predicted DsbA family dithiol-disulfide isomerase